MPFEPEKGFLLWKIFSYSCPWRDTVLQYMCWIWTSQIQLPKFCNSHFNLVFITDFKLCSHVTKFTFLIGTISNKVFFFYYGLPQVFYCMEIVSCWAMFTYLLTAKLPEYISYATGSFLETRQLPNSAYFCIIPHFSLGMFQTCKEFCLTPHSYFINNLFLEEY